MNFNFEITKINFDEVNEILRKKGLCPNGRTQQFFTNEVMRLSDDYVPFDTGMLKNNVTVGQDSTFFTYNSIYAHYLWEGKLMVDPIYKIGAFHNDERGFWSRKGVPKVYGNRNLNIRGGRKDHWVNYMWNNYKDKIISSTEKFMEKR